VVRAGLSDGEPITDTRVVRPGDRGFLSAVLNPGSRAVTVNLTPSSGLAGLVFPGDRVDLIGTFRVPDESKDAKNNIPRFASETVLSDIRVLAVDQRVDDQNKEVVIAKTATLEVTPKQVEILALVGELGKFSLSLRSLAHADEANAGGKKQAPYTWDNEAARMLPPISGAGAMNKVTVVRAGDVKDVEIPRSGR
jgi:pilus assembly protein CpaB